jgi:alpha-ribazole phosphatase
LENKETRWWWVRHAPVPNSVHIYGQSDVDSDCSNQEVFKALAAELPRKAVWLTSNLARTHQTAAAIIAELDEKARPKEKPVAIPEFAEQNLGEWQGLVREEFFASRGQTSYPFWFGPSDERPPGGESFNDVVARVGPMVSHLNKKFSGRDIIAVAHGGTIRAALAAALNLDPNAALAFSVENCSITRIDHLSVLTEGDFWRIAMANHRPWSRTLVRALHGSATAPQA